MAEKKRSKSDLVADQMMRFIREGRWKVGEKLPPEPALEREFDVSRVCLRESLKKLEVIGILEIRQGDGTYVREINLPRFMEPLFFMMSVDAESINDIYELRIALEGNAYKKSAQLCANENLEHITALVREMDNCFRVGDLTGFSVADRSFHEYILEISGERLTIMFCGMFREIISEHISKLNSDPRVLQQAQIEHKQILWAIKQKQPELVGQLMAMHLERSRLDILRMVNFQS